MTLRTRVLAFILLAVGVGGSLVGLSEFLSHGDSDELEHLGNDSAPAFPITVEPAAPGERSEVLPQGEELVSCQVVIAGMPSRSVEGSLAYRLGSNAVFGLEARAVLSNGECRFSFAGEKRFVVTGILVGNRHAFPRLAEQAIASSRKLTVAASFDLDYCIPVIDSTTDIPFKAVQVIALPVEEPGSVPIRTSRTYINSADQGTASVLRDIDAPIESRQLTPGKYLVSSPGYAWERFELSSRGPSAGIIELGAAGSIRLAVFGGAEDAVLGGSCRLRLLNDGPTNSEDHCAYSIDISRPLQVLSQLAVGPYRAILESAARNCRATEIASAHIAIRAGEETLVEFNAPDIFRGLEPTMVAGMVYFANEKEEQEITHISFNASDVSSPKEVKPIVLLVSRKELAFENGVWTWNPIALLPGTYQVQLSPSRYLCHLVVPRQSEWIADIKVPATYSLNITIVDSRTSEVIPLHSWYAAYADSSSVLERIDIGGHCPLSPENPIKLQARAGPVGLKVLATGYGTRRFYFEAKHDGKKILTLDAESIIRVQLIAFGYPIGLEAGWWADLQAAPVQPNEGQYTGLALGQDSELQSSSWATLTFSSPGQYSLKLPVISGYSVAPSTRAVNLVSGRNEFISLDITECLLR